MFFSNPELISQKNFIVINFPDRTKILLVRSGGPGFRTKIPDQAGPVRNSGPSDRTKNKMVRKSGPPDRTKLSWSGIPDHRTGPDYIGPEFRTTGPDQNLVGPEFRTTDRTGPIPDRRSGHPCLMILIRVLPPIFYPTLKPVF